MVAHAPPAPTEPTTTPALALGASGPVLPVDVLRERGRLPGEPVSVDEALAYCRRLVGGRYENFSVLSGLVPASLRDDFAAVYAFCRWADDLGDETGLGDEARARSLELLAWWREELAACFAGEPRHEVFVALRATVERHRLPIGPFEDLIGAFERDQTQTRYETWDDLVSYCRGSADPVGRIVLMLGGVRPPEETPESAEMWAMSDAICTALQITNHIQDVRRDLFERDRVYLPSVETGLRADELRSMAERGNDPEARVRYIKAVRSLVERTAELFERGRPLPALCPRTIGPVVGLLASGGRRTLAKIEKAGCTTLWKRPTLSKPEKAMLVVKACVRAKLSGGGSS